MSMAVEMVRDSAVVTPLHVFELPVGGVNLDAVEKSLILQALERTGRNQSASARLLGISRYALRYRMAKHALR